MSHGEPSILAIIQQQEHDTKLMTTTTAYPHYSYNFQLAHKNRRIINSSPHPHPLPLHPTPFPPSPTRLPSTTGDKGKGHTLEVDLRRTAQAARWSHWLMAMRTMPRVTRLRLRKNARKYL